MPSLISPEPDTSQTLEQYVLAGAIDVRAAQAMLLARALHGVQQLRVAVGGLALYLQTTCSTCRWLTAEDRAVRA